MTREHRLHVDAPRKLHAKARRPQKTTKEPKCARRRMKVKSDGVVNALVLRKSRLGAWTTTRACPSCNDFRIHETHSLTTPTTTHICLPVLHAKGFFDA